MKIPFFILVITLLAYRKKHITIDQFVVCLALIVIYMLAIQAFGEKN